MAHILIADDEPGIRTGLVAICMAGGHRTSEAGTGAETLRVAAAERPDLVLLDLRMPEGDGLEVLPKLAAMVMAASGGTCFDSMIQSVNRNIDKAEQEKRLTEDKIQQFQRDIGADSVKMKMIDDHDTIVAEIAAKSSSIATPSVPGMR